MERRMALLALVLISSISLCCIFASSGQIPPPVWPVNLALSKSVDNATPSAGDAIVYTITIRHNGSLFASNVQVTDVLPSGVRYDDHVTGNGSYDPDGGVWTIGNLVISQASLEIYVIVDEVPPGTVITNTADITNMDQQDTYIDNNSDSVSIMVQGSVEEPGSQEPAVEIDVKPGSDPNSINPNSNGVIAVAILTTETFDAADVNGAAVTFGPGNAEPAHGDGHLEDVDGDGKPDWVGHFRTKETGIQPGDTEVTLNGQTQDGQIFQASDDIVTVGKPKKSK